jgi:chemotaxis protein MotA
MHARGIPALVGLLLGVVVIAWAHLSTGGDLATFANPAALAVVFGGTMAALLVSFPAQALREAVVAVARLAGRQPTPLEELVPTFIDYARRVRRHGMLTVEPEIERTQDEFLARALALSVSNLPAGLVREALSIEARVCAERDEARAEVFDAAAGYAPTLGIVGAVLGLMHVMQGFGTTASVGPGIAAAFVSTIYGVGAANLVFLPLATRLRARSSRETLRRELVIDGVLALQDGASPAVVGERLSGYLHARGAAALKEAA